MTTSDAELARLYEPRAWAAHELGLADPVSAEAARLALVRKLADADFLPPRRWQAAWRMMESRNSVGQPAAEGFPADLLPAMHPEEALLRARIDDLADRFFGLPPEARQDAWQQLCRASPLFPALRQRLTALERGLHAPADVGPTNREDSTGKMTGLSCEMTRLFALSPSERMRLWQRRWGRPQPVTEEEIAAAGALATSNLDSAKLLPNLLARLRTWNPHRVSMIARRLNSPAEEVVLASMARVPTSAEADYVIDANAKHRVRTENPPIVAPNRFPVMLAVMVVCGIVSALFRASDRPILPTPMPGLPSVKDFGYPLTDAILNGEGWRDFGEIAARRRQELEDRAARAGQLGPGVQGPLNDREPAKRGENGLSLPTHWPLPPDELQATASPSAGVLPP